MTVLFDIEADGFDPSVVHCICLAYGTTGEVRRYHDDPDLPRDGDLDTGVEILEQADVRVAHNGYGYDFPVLERLLGLARCPAEEKDSIVLSRLAWPDLKPADWNRQKRGIEHPGRLIGSHALEAWGHRLGEHKGNYEGGWDELTEDMLVYCEQDVRVLQKLWAAIKRKKLHPGAVELEEDFARVLQGQMDRGFSFDERAAVELQGTLEVHRARLEDEIASHFEDFEDTYVTPKKKIEKTRITVFNPRSRDHIARGLREQYGWKPDSFTETGKPKLDESTLGGLDYPPALALNELFMVNKRLGQLADGNQAWLKLVKDGRIYGRIIHNGAVTSRCTHSGPNVGQVPSVGKPYGHECRSLWRATPGMVMVGTDAKGIELRILAHYLQPYDGGRLIKTLESGADPHEQNRIMAGLPKEGGRAQAKVLVYATMYGAGDKKIASSLGVPLKEAKEIRQKVLDGLGLGQLISDVKARAKNYGWLRGLDGRKLTVRHEHAALNTLIQGGMAVWMKMWTVLANQELEGTSWHQVAHVHDEMQGECLAAEVELVQDTMARTCLEAGEKLNLRIKTEADSRSGPTWAETH